MKGDTVPEPRASQDRASLLADVAEMYYLQDMNQAQIARVVGVTRSMVSRMLSEARQKGIVDVTIRRPLQSDRELEAALAARFKLRAASVVMVRAPDDRRLLRYLGQGAADLLQKHLPPKTVVGLAWGTSISAAVDAIPADERAALKIKIVQLVGALGARNNEYDGHGLVMRLAEKLGGEAYYLNAPFICQNRQMARALMNAQSIRETIVLARKVNVALVGVGSTSPKYSSFYLAGYVPLAELKAMIAAGAVGDVCGLHFDISGREKCGELCERLVTIQKDDLLKIPLRIGVAGGPGKVNPILGALRIGYINALVTDSVTAKKLLELAQTKRQAV